MPGMITAGKSVFWIGELIRSSYLKSVIFEETVQRVFLAVGDPQLLQEYELGNKNVDDLMKIEMVPTESFNVEGGQLNI